MVRSLNRVAVLLLIASIGIVGCTGIDSINSGINRINKEKKLQKFHESTRNKYVLGTLKERYPSHSFEVVDIVDSLTESYKVSVDDETDRYYSVDIKLGGDLTETVWENVYGYVLRDKYEKYLLETISKEFPEVFGVYSVFCNETDSLSENSTVQDILDTNVYSNNVLFIDESKTTSKLDEMNKLSDYFQSSRDSIEGYFELGMISDIEEYTSGIRELSSKEMYDMYKASGDSKEASTVYSKGYGNVEDKDTDDYVDDDSDAQ